MKKSSISFAVSFAALLCALAVTTTQAQIAKVSVSTIGSVLHNEHSPTLGTQLPAVDSKFKLIFRNLLDR